MLHNSRENDAFHTIFEPKAKVSFSKKSYFQEIQTNIDSKFNSEELKRIIYKIQTELCKLGRFVEHDSDSDSTYDSDDNSVSESESGDSESGDDEGPDTTSRTVLIPPIVPPKVFPRQDSHKVSALAHSLGVRAIRTKPEAQQVPRLLLSERPPQQQGPPGYPGKRFGVSSSARKPDMGSASLIKNQPNNTESQKTKNVSPFNRRIRNPLDRGSTTARESTAAREPTTYKQPNTAREPTSSNLFITKGPIGLSAIPTSAIPTSAIPTSAIDSRHRTANDDKPPDKIIPAYVRVISNANTLRPRPPPPRGPRKGGRTKRTRKHKKHIPTSTSRRPTRRRNTKQHQEGHKYTRKHPRT
jgi:hypothetical protein